MSPYFTDGETEAGRVSTLLVSPQVESTRAGLEPETKVGLLLSTQ